MSKKNKQFFTTFKKIINDNKFIIIVVLICIIIIYLIMNVFLTDDKKYKNIKFSKINTQLDSEHGQIFDAFSNLLEKCKNHWATEDKLYEEGIKKMPSMHKDITSEWKIHSQEHSNLIKSIEELQQKVVDHIETKDVPHFHWLK